jgi:hypothetical protein
MGEPPFCGTNSLLQIFQQESKLAVCVKQTGLNYRAHARWLDTLKSFSGINSLKT